MNRAFALLAPLAALQLAVPAAAGGRVIAVEGCGQLAGHPVPVRLPLRKSGEGSPCCGKICHISMRKRAAADSCCGEEDDSDVA